MARLARSISQVKQRKNRQSLRKAEALQLRALRLTLQGKYSRAAAAYRTAIALASRIPSPDRTVLAALLNNFGVLSKYAGQFAQAKELYERAGKLMPLDDPHFRQSRATLYHNLAGLAQARGQYARALQHARRGIRLRGSPRRGDALSLLADQVALAVILVELGKLREANAIYLRALRAYRRKFGTNHYETASLLSNLGALYLKAGRLDKAEQTLRRAARVLEDVLGRNHPRLATVLNNLAVVCVGRGKSVEADALYARVLRLLERQSRPTYPSIALVRANRRKLQTKLKAG